MDAELMTIFSNINSLVDQAKQMLGGESQGEQGQPEVAEKIMKFLKEMDKPKEDDAEALKKSDDEDKDDEEVKKSAQEKTSPADAGVTASDKAVERVEETSPEQEKNINEIARSIANMMVNKSKNVNKSNDSELYTVLKVIVAEQNEVKKSVENILAGLGVAEQVKKINEVQKSQDVRRPLNDQNEIQKSLDFIKSELGARDNRPVGNSSETVHKSLSDALAGMVGK